MRAAHGVSVQSYFDEQVGMELQMINGGDFRMIIDTRVPRLRKRTANYTIPSVDPIQGPGRAR